ncbi:hypothetical protein ACIBEJ_39670 [Nonomuraea sp. NPDC050790]|uniref:hypothetical protein n=1 Tax=Nonomuraea sp. NPDC050790 TaxID=3364371 RepID=UPI00379E2C46
MNGVEVRPKGWHRESLIHLLKLTACVVALFVVTLVVDYFTKGPAEITATYLTVRPLTLAFFWLIGAIFIWRWGYIRSLKRQNDSNGVEQ